MRWLTLNGTVKCGHGGGVALTALQQWLTIEGVPVLVVPDPVGRAISSCPNVSTNLLPCTVTGSITLGTSNYVRIDGRAVVLDTLIGVTNSAPPSQYSVTRAGQAFVEER